MTKNKAFVFTKLVVFLISVFIVLGGCQSAPKQILPEKVEVEPEVVAPPPPPEPAYVDAPEDAVVYFGYDEYFIDDKYLADDSFLFEFLDYLYVEPESSVVIEGYASLEGSDKYNQKLSLRRANRVKKFFLDNDIEPERVEATAYGKENPVNDDINDEQGQALNRRVMLKILD